MPPRPNQKKPAEEAPKEQPTEALASQLMQVTEEVSKAKQLRNYFQLERDKIAKFWEVSKDDLDNHRAALMNLQADIQEAEEKHAVELKVYQQKVRHLTYQHRVHLQLEREATEQSVRDCVHKHREGVDGQKGARKQIVDQVAEQKTEHYDRVEEKRREDARMLQLQRQEQEKVLRETSDKYERKLKAVAQELELRRKAEIHDVEERTNEHIAALVEKHAAAFGEMKQYHNDVTQDNLELITELKAAVTDMMHNEHNNNNLMSDIAAENRRLNEPLERALKEVESLKGQLSSLKRDQESLHLTRSRLRVVENQYQGLQEKHSKMQEDYAGLEQKKDALLSRFESSLSEVAQVAQHRNRQLQSKLADVQAAVDQKDAQLTAVLQAASLDPAAMDQITAHLEEILETKNRAIKDLHFELAKVAAQHTDVRRAYERKCVAAGLPPLDLDAAGLICTTIHE
eukprot:NODE_793_length_1775_cov_107.610081_g648_i0.p1 GENE.NODE_793_length_1775_cov_107.610081_g648_i0~~NODE_793_length_1775_cov_107.610081_g648_i0.p1  ORF type:complete len:457 (-),score=141.49 NODE_793_length_1775_cov_107.610081_g648_i0:69-1439(-)